MNNNNSKDKEFFLYGPVPSRRLGYSLGVDIVPFKTCTLDCIYCQLGPTTHKTLQRKSYFSAQGILSQIKKAIGSGQKIDYITFSGSGEPTLNSSLEELIKGIKNITSIPVAVLTNTTLFSQKKVRKALLEADLVIPSLDAVTQELFLNINRPYSSLSVEKIIQSLKKFRVEFKGKIWLEIMLIKGINDSPPHIQKLKQVISEIKPDKVQLNTVIRPPTEKYARALSLKELKKIQNELGGNCELIASFQKKEQIPSIEGLEKAILSLVRRRPVTVEDISSSLGKHRDEILKYLNFLLEEEKIKYITHQGKKYYEPK